MHVSVYTHIKAKASVCARTTPSGDEIHHGIGDVLLMVTVGDPGWAGYARCGPTDVGLDSGPSSSSLPSSSLRLFRRVGIYNRVVFMRVSGANLRGTTALSRTVLREKERSSCQPYQRFSRNLAIAAQEPAPDRFTSVFEAILYDGWLARGIF